MAARAGAAPVVPRPAPARRHAETAARPRPRPPAAGAGVAVGIAWIALVAVLLTGVVALNVAVLRLNVRLDELGRERADLRAKNAALASRVSSSVAPARIESIARMRLGLVPASETAYVDLAPTTSRVGKEATP